MLKLGALPRQHKCQPLTLGVCPASCAAAGPAEQPKADSKAQGKAKKAEAEKQAANGEEQKRRQVRAGLMG